MKQTISRTLIMAVVSITIVTMAMSFAISALNTEKLVTNLASETLTNRLVNVSAQVENWYDSLNATFQNFTNELYKNPNTTLSEKSDSVYNTFRNFPYGGYLYDLYAGFPDKGFITSTGFIPPPGYDPTSRDWYKLACEHPGEMVITPAYTDDTDSGKWCITAARTIHPKDGSLGVIAADYTYGSLNRLLSSLNSGDTNIIILQNDGNIITHPDISSYVNDYGIIESVATLDNGSYKEFYDTLKTEVGDTFRLSVKGVDNYYACRKIGNGWYVLAFESADAFRKPLYDMIVSLLAVSCASIMGIIVTMVLVTRSKVGKPLSKLTAAIREFSVDDTVSFAGVEIETNNELKILTQTLQSMELRMRTAFNEAQAANLAKSNFLSRMSQEMRTPMLVINEKAEVEYISNSFIEWFDFEDDWEAINRSIFDLPISDEIKLFFTDGFNHHKSVQKNLELTKDGKQYWFMMRSSLLGNDNISRVFELVDITELIKAKNEAEFATRSKNDFLAKMSHEIRTPMNAIIGMSELLLNEGLNERQKEYVSDINLSSHSLLDIINEILDFSKIEAGKMELVSVNYDFNVFLTNLRSMLKYVAEEKGLEFISETEGPIPDCLYGDDLRLRQILVNLSSNAIKFTSEGYIRMKVTAKGDLLIFDIADTGIGIREEDMKNLFASFVQADIQKNRDVKGTGLGLAISKSFTEMMGGSITVSSVYGKGTTFTVTIPKVLGDKDAITESALLKSKKTLRASSAEILVVDDNKVNLKVARGLLNLFKVNIDIAFSGREALKMIAEKDYDIVFMDHMMPEMDGIETTQEIRKLGGKYQQLTIIALTANAIRGAKEIFLASGLNGFISKPIEINELSAILQEFLPPEKIEKSGELPSVKTEAAQTVALPQKTTGTSFLDSVKNINGIDPEIWLSRISGAEDIYHETLELWCKMLPGDCDKLKNFLSAKDLHNFSILVHSLKSSLSMIGAMELSETALLLEKASKGNDLDYCEKHFPGFLSVLRELQGQIAILFPEVDAAPRTEGDIEYLREKVRKALSALDELDSDTAEAEIEKARAYDFDIHINELLKNSKDSLADYDYTAATEFLDEIIKLI